MGKHKLIHSNCFLIQKAINKEQNDPPTGTNTATVAAKKNLTASRKLIATDSFSIKKKKIIALRIL